MRRVDRAADVHQDVNPRHLHRAGQAVDQDLDRRGPVGEVEERVAPAGLAVEVNAGRGVEAPGPEVHPLLVGPADQVLERDPAARAGGRRSRRPPRRRRARATAAIPSLGRGQEPRRRPRPAAPLRISAGPDGGHPVEVGAGRGGRRRGVVVLLRRGRHHLHRLGRQRELVGHELADLGVQALAHLRPAGRDLHGAVEVDVHQRVALVERPPGERDPELDGRQRQALQVRPSTRR